jgi:hypothetical protein
MQKHIEKYITKNYYELLKIAQTITKGKGGDLYKDLLHHTILELMERKEIKLKTGSDDEIKYYIVASMRIGWYSKTSSFSYKVTRESKKYVELSEIMEIESDQESFEKQIIFDILEQSWAELDIFRKSLFEMYMVIGSMNNLSKQTNIPLSSIKRYIKESREEIKKNVIKKLNL